MIREKADRSAHLLPALIYRDDPALCDDGHDHDYDDYDDDDHIDHDNYEL